MDVAAIKSGDRDLVSADWKEELRVRTFFSRSMLVAGIMVVLAASGLSTPALADDHGGTSGQPDFGPNVMIFDPSMPTATIQATVDAIPAQQVPNQSQFEPQRYALLFKPGTYRMGPVSADAMYNGEYHSYNGAGTVKVVQ